MKPTTHIACYAQNIGKPEESLRCEGPMIDVSRQIVAWLAARTMAKGIRIEIGRNQQELGLKQSRQQDLDSLVDDIFTGMESADVN